MGERKKGLLAVLVLYLLVVSTANTGCCLSTGSYSGGGSQNPSSTTGYRGSSSSITANFVLTPSPTPYASEDSDLIRLGNGLVEFQFSRPDKGALVGLVRKEANVDFIVNKTTWSLFTFYWGVPLPFPEHHVGSADAQAFSYSYDSINSGAWVQLVWSDFWDWSLQRVLKVRVEAMVELDANSTTARWHLTLQNMDNVTIEGVQFPRIEGLGAIGKSPLNSYLAYPAWGGVLFQDPLGNLRNFQRFGYKIYYPSYGSNMQFLTYYSTELNAGIYMASLDTEGYMKSYQFWKDLTGLTIVFDYPVPGFRAGNSVEIPYDFCFGVSSGDWYDAARMYKNWAVRQWWVSAVNARRDIPEDFMEATASIVVYTRFFDPKAEESDLPVERLVEMAHNTLQVPLYVQWNGWEKDGCVTNSPEVFPPHEGWEAFNATVRRIHQNGGYLLPLVETLYSQNLTSWSTAEHYAMRNRDGTLALCNYSAFCTNYALMDPSTTFFQQTLLNLTTTLARYGFDGVYLDCFPHGVTAVCYDTSHGHPVGGGNWFFSAWRDLLVRIRNETRKLNPHFTITGEGMAEVYLPYFDGFLEEGFNSITPEQPSFVNSFLNLTKISFIPLWHTVYHEYSRAYGMFVFLHTIHITRTLNSSLLFYLRAIGMHITQGIIPNAWVQSSFWLSASPDLNAYFQKVALGLKTYARDFALAGVALRPPVLNVTNIRTGWVYQVPGTMIPYPPFSFPSVLSSGWLAADGRIAYLFTNVANQSIAFDFSIDLKQEGAPNEPRIIYEVQDGSIRQLDIYMGSPKTIKVSVAPLEIVMLLLARPKDAPLETVTEGEMDGRKFNLKIASNSTILTVTFDPSRNSVAIRLFGSPGSTGYINVTIAKELLNGPFTTSISGIPVPFHHYENATHSSILVNYEYPSADSYVGHQLVIEVLIGVERTHNVTFNINPRVASVNIDRTEYDVQRLPASFQWIQGSQHSFHVEPIIQVSQDMRYIFVRWDDGNASVSRSIVIENPASFLASFKLQYRLTVSSEYGMASGGGWYDANSTATFSVTTPVGTLVQQVFVGWSGDSTAATPSGTVLMNGPKAVMANWRTDYTQLYIIILIIALAIAALILLMRRRRRSPLLPPPPSPPESQSLQPKTPPPPPQPQQPPSGIESNTNDWCKSVKYLLNSII